MKKIEMIKSKKEFTNIFNNKKFIKNKYFTIYSISSDITNPKFGIAISKSFGKAFERNYIKRVVRNILDTNKKSFKNNRNYIIMIKGTCKGISYQQLDKSFKKLLEESK